MPNLANYEPVDLQTVRQGGTHFRVDDPSTHRTQLVYDEFDGDYVRETIAPQQDDIAHHIRSGSAIIHCSQTQGMYPKGQEDAFSVAEIPPGSAVNATEREALLKQGFQVMAGVADQSTSNAICTANALWVDKQGGLTAANLGDSRTTAFLIEKETGNIYIHQISEDQRTPDGKPTHAFGNSVTKQDYGRDPHIISLTVQDVLPPGRSPQEFDILVAIYSDGLIEDKLTNEKLASALHAHHEAGANSPYKNMAKLLTDFAYQQGSTDNLTCVIVPIRPGKQQESLITVADGSQNRNIARVLIEALEQVVHRGLTQEKQGNLNHPAPLSQSQTRER